MSNETQQVVLDKDKVENLRRILKTLEQNQKTLNELLKIYSKESKAKDDSD